MCTEETLVSNVSPQLVLGRHRSHETATVTKHSVKFHVRPNKTRLRCFSVAVVTAAGY